MSYISSLNLLNADSPVPVNEEIFQEELALWANAQFSFDTKPGTAVGAEDIRKENLFETLSKLTQLVQPETIQQQNNTNAQLEKYYVNIQLPSVATLPTTNFPRIAPAPGPGSALQQLESITLSNDKKKRNISDVVDESDLSVDDDKRRRNTAASARFRMKKKLREQALEKTTKEIADNVEKLEAKVKELEREREWLKNLVIEKDPSLLPSKEISKD